jgi:hypothetical protein
MMVTMAHHDLVSAASEDDLQPARLRLLLDSNIVVALEPYAGDLEANLPAAAELARLASELGHVLCVAPATRDDVLENADPMRRRQRLEELRKFSHLEESPLTEALREAAGDSLPGSNDHRDLRLLASVASGAANYLVTEDRALVKRARRAGHGERVLNLAGAVELLRGFLPPQWTTPPRVVRVPAYTLDVDDDIFRSLREDYSGFDEWLGKVRADSDRRTCLLVKEDDKYAALALLKPEPDCEYDLPGPVIKISTFKVGAHYQQAKLGELLLKAIMGDAHHAGAGALYVTVFDKHQPLIALLTMFGFVDIGARTDLGERVLAKTLRAPECDEHDDLTHHILYGPPALRARQSGYLVPIWPKWHDQLFPETVAHGDQLKLFEPQTHPWGNALRKAYLCRSATRQIAPGDLLFFYRSQGRATICAVGIVEDTLRSSDPTEVSSFVGLRTVYTFEEISDMCGRVNGLLAITFRQDRFLDPELTLTELKLAGVLRQHPQQIQRIPEEGMAWLRERLTESR